MRTTQLCREWRKKINTSRDTFIPENPKVMKSLQCSRNEKKVMNSDERRGNPLAGEYTGCGDVRGER